MLRAVVTCETSGDLRPNFTTYIDRRLTAVMLTGDTERRFAPMSKSKKTKRNVVQAFNAAREDHREASEKEVRDRLAFHEMGLRAAASAENMALAMLILDGQISLESRTAAQDAIDALPASVLDAARERAERLHHVSRWISQDTTMPPPPVAGEA